MFRKASYVLSFYRMGTKLTLFTELLAPMASREKSSSLVMFMISRANEVHFDWD